MGRLDGKVAIVTGGSAGLGRADAMALAFAVLATLIAGVAIGLLPAWQAGRADLRGTIVRGGRGVVGDASRARRLLVATEVALAVALTVGAGMLIRSLSTLMAGEPGFEPRNVATVAVIVRTGSPVPVTVASFQTYPPRAASMRDCVLTSRNVGDESGASQLFTAP